MTPMDHSLPSTPSSSATQQSNLTFRCTAIAIGLLIVFLSEQADSQQPPTLPKGFKASIWAPEHLLANPVSISFDKGNRLYVAEAHRKKTGVWGVTFSRWWAMEDYQASTLADREAMYERWAHVIPETQLKEQSDLVRVIDDTDNDGLADRSEVFSTNYNHPLDGNAAGILALDDAVFFACIPHLWKLEDTDQNRQADIKTPLHRGFGVRVGVHGHDLHGLIQGPDGMIYFTVGDRGYDVAGYEGARLSESHRGAVFRCYPDGSHLEVFHRGLRNPQELAFNDYGDLFTVDNNMSGGDECRILHLLEGADSGWDASYQLSGHFRTETQRTNHTKPIWFTEKLWSQPFPGQPHWHNPAIGHLSRGPSGLAHYPGVGLPDSFQDTFFLADFVGNQANSGILSFKLTSEGASYRLATSEKFAWNLLATDLEFGNDGNLYVSDWINGWTGTGAGRIWKIESPTTNETLPETDNQVLESPQYSQLPLSQLGDLLGHRDRRIRHRSQLELATRGTKGLNVFTRRLQQSTQAITQIHALWGLGQMAAKEDNHSSFILPIVTALSAEHSEVRAQAAKIIGNLSLPINESHPLLTSLNEDHPRVLYHAIMSASKSRLIPATQPIIKVLQTNLANDPAIRHAGVTFLATMLNSSTLAGMNQHLERTIREAAVLALRRQKSPLIKSFLTDPDTEIAYEAIRAIHDLPIPELQETLASLVQEGLAGERAYPFPIAHRLLNANFRIGTAKHAIRVVETAANRSLSFDLRLEALESLKQWNDPSVFDRVTWQLRPHTQAREKDIGPIIKPALLETFDGFLSEASKISESDLQRALAAITQTLIEHELIDDQMAKKVVHRKELPSDARSQFLRHLTDNRSLHIEAAESLLSDPEPQIQAIAAASLVHSKDERGWEFFERSLGGENATLIQHSIAELRQIDSDRKSSILADALDRATNSNFPRGAWLDLYEIAEELPEMRSPLNRFLKAQIEGNELGIAILSSEGGNADRGKRHFEQHEAQCIRCHQIKGFGGSAGPDLTKSGVSLNRHEILESLLMPSKRIAPGFETTTLDLSDGDVISGIIQQETNETLTLRTADRSTITLSKSQISHRSKQQSSMPPMGGILSRKELRDLVAYIANQK